METEVEIKTETGKYGATGKGHNDKYPNRQRRRPRIAYVFSQSAIGSTFHAAHQISQYLRPQDPHEAHAPRSKKGADGDDNHDDKDNQR